MTEAAKLRFLLDKVYDPQIEIDVSALRVKNNLSSGEDKMIFTKAENIGDGISFKLTKLSI